MSTSINSVNLADLITIPEAAKRTPLTEGQLRGWIDRGYIPVGRFGRRIFVTAEDLKRLLGRQYREPTPASAVFFFKQKTAYEIGLGIPAEPLFRSQIRRQPYQQRKHQHQHAPKH